MKIGSLLRDSAIGTVYFFIGYIIGTLYDILSFQLYRKIDPNLDKSWRLVPVVFLQLYILAVGVAWVSLLKIPFIEVFFLRMGLVTSQIFLLQWTMKRLVNKHLPPDIDTAARTPKRRALADLIPY